MVPSGQEVLPPGREDGTALEDRGETGVGDEAGPRHHLVVVTTCPCEAFGRAGARPVVDLLGASRPGDGAPQIVLFCFVLRYPIALSKSFKKAKYG